MNIEDKNIIFEKPFAGWCKITANVIDMNNDEIKTFEVKGSYLSNIGAEFLSAACASYKYATEFSLSIDCEDAGRITIVGNDHGAYIIHFEDEVKIYEIQEICNQYHLISEIFADIKENQKDWIEWSKDYLVDDPRHNTEELYFANKIKEIKELMDKKNGNNQSVTNRLTKSE